MLARGACGSSGECGVASAAVVPQASGSLAKYDDFPDVPWGGAQEPPCARGNLTASVAAGRFGNGGHLVHLRVPPTSSAGAGIARVTLSLYGATMLDAAAARFNKGETTIDFGGPVPRGKYTVRVDVEAGGCLEADLVVGTK